MANISGASLTQIQQRLRDTPAYHPFDADTFCDWAMEAGDIVTVRRGEESYQSPIHSSHLVWRGKQNMELNASGTKERDAIARVSKQKYARGGYGMRQQKSLYYEFYSEDGYLHGLFEVSESHMRSEFEDVANSLRGEFEVTASHLRSEFEDAANGLRGEFEVTASHLRSEFNDTANSLRGEFEVTASHLRGEFEDVANSIRGEFEVTASHLRGEFEDVANSLRGDFEVTASHLRTDFMDADNSLRSEFEVTASHLRTEFEDGSNSLRSEFEITAGSLRAEFEDSASSLKASIQAQANRIGLVVEGTGANAKIKPAAIVAAINDAGESVANISADKITLDGTTKLSGAMTISGGSLVVSKNLTVSGDVQASNYVVNTGGHVRFIGSGTGEHYDFSSSDLSGMIVKAEVDSSTNTLKLWKKGDPAASPSITFKKAASVTALTGSWSGGTLTVVTTPDTGHSFVITPSLDLNGYGTESFSAEMSASDSSGSTAVRSSIYGYLNLTGSKTGSTVTVSKNSDGTGVVASKSVGSVYTAGWNAAYGKVTMPGKGTDTTFDVLVPPSDVDGDAVKKTFTITKGTPGTSGYAAVSLSGTVVGRIDISDWYTTGKTDGGDAAGLTIDTTNHKIKRSTSSSVKEYPITVSCGTPSYNSSTHKYSFSADAKADTTTVNTGSTSSGTEAYDAGKTDGYNSAHVTGTWSNNTFTYSKTNDSTKPNSASVQIGMRFNSASTGYYVSAYRTVGSSTSDIANTATYYKLGTNSAGTVVQVQDRNGNQIGNTPIYNLPTIGISSSSAWVNAGKSVTIYATKNGSNVTSAACTVTARSIGYITTDANGNHIGDWWNYRCYTQKNGTLVCEGSTDGANYGIYIPGSSPSHTITSFNTTSPSGQSYGSIVNGTEGYMLVGSGNDATAYIVTKSTWNCDGNSKTGVSYLQSAPTLLYKKGYADGGGGGGGTHTPSLEGWGRSDWSVDVNGNVPTGYIKIAETSRHNAGYVYKFKISVTADCQGVKASDSKGYYIVLT